MNRHSDLKRRPWHEWLGMETRTASHRERILAGLGGACGVLLVFAASRLSLSGPDAAVMTLSMGASAVLLFAVPHGPLSQPWPLVGGHLVSALLGVACARLVPQPALAAALAVGLSITVMHYLRCIHPPGGATALAAVLGGEAVQALGFCFVLAPVAVNVLVMLAVAIVFNAPFAWRRYPAVLAHRPHQASAAVQPYAAISHEDFVFALSELDAFVDVSEDDLLRIYALATRRQGDRSPATER